MNILSYTIKEPEEVLSQLQITKKGLTEQEATKRLNQYGQNTIEDSQVGWWSILVRQLKSPFLYLLIVAALLSLFLGEVVDGILIFVFVAVNTILGFYQEFKSEQTLKLLKQFISSQVKVLRGGTEQSIKSEMLVPGDIVVFEAGDSIPADLRLLEQTDLAIDESSLTGESIAVKKETEKMVSEPKELYKAINICFSGTTVIEGKGMGVVINTGKNTAMGEISHLTLDTKRISSFEKEIAKFSKFILYLILGTLILLFFINLIIKGFDEIPTLLIFSIALAVSVIPEALPVVITFSLSRGALKLAHHKVVVKRLSAVEDLGSIEILCTDKTGTLTENQLILDKMYPETSETLVLHAALASSSAKHKNKSAHSFDLAVLNSLSSENQKQMESYEKTAELPFDPIRKRSSVIVKQGPHQQLIARGAPEEILKLCSGLDEKEKRSAEEWLKAEGSIGRRVIAIANKNIESNVTDLEKEEKGLTFLGFISFVDPVKKSAHDAVKKAKLLGLQLKVLTGDSREVAGAVAKEIGLIEKTTDVITGEEFEALSTVKQLETVNAYNVFARVSPQQKYKIIQLLQQKHEVGFLGEGINDAPALKIANVAIVVQEATDIAREAADIILLKKSLSVIVEGIEEGRAIFANTAKYIRATLASNFGNFYTVAIASLLIPFLPLLPLQILLINLLTDFPMITVASDNVDPGELQRPRQYDIKDIALIGMVLGVVSSIFDFIFFVLFVHISPAVLQTNWFIGSVLTELLFLFSIRTRLPIFKAQRPAFIIVFCSIIAAAIAIILPYTPIGISFFSFKPPSFIDLIRIILIVVAYFISTEVVKNIYYKLFSEKKVKSADVRV